MAKYKPENLRTKTTDELKEQLKLLRKEQFNYMNKLVILDLVLIQSPFILMENT